MTTRTEPLIAALLCTAVATGGSAQGFADPNRAAKLAATYPQIDQAFREFASREHIPGAAWGIIVDGKLAHVGVAGLRDVANKAPVDANSVFRIASMTKSFTAMAILKLRDEGKLSLDDLAEKYVPELSGLKYPTTDAPRITIRHLLSHAAGFPEDNPWGDQQLAVTDAQMSLMMRSGIPFSNAPGVAYEYSNYGFAILGRIVSNVSGVPYRDYVKTNILDPLGMSATTLEPGSVPANRLALGYRWEDNQWKLEPQLPDGAFGAMGGMLTSLQDLGAYVSAFLAAWPARDGAESAPISRASLREMQRIHNPRTPLVRREPSGATRLSTGGYGFGLGISSTCLFEHVVAHSGGLPGFGSQMRWLPEYGVGLIAFGNRTYTGWGAPFDTALQLLSSTGALQPRLAAPAPALVEARNAVTRLVLNWNASLADSIAAVNLFLDQSADRRRANVAALIGKVGPCTAGSGFAYVENALRGEWVLPCQRGQLRVAITLAPTVPPRVQYLDVSDVAVPGMPGRPRLCAG